MSDNNLRIDVIPRDLYYHEVAYVRGLEKRIEALEAALRKDIYPAMAFAIGSVSGPTTDEEVALMWQWIDEAYAEYISTALNKDRKGDLEDAGK